ncbi:MAG TPA: hypothetical protein VMZ28_17310, partial [Kofleriaceae bacterium]|nr:hypothetical protein [Kofleriaceae bacterium]
GDYEVTYSSDGSEEQSSLHLDGASEYDVVLPKARRMTVFVIGKRCKDLRRLGRLRIICYRSLVDRAMHEVDQSPHQLTPGGRRLAPRPPR